MTETLAAAPPVEAMALGPITARAAVAAGAAALDRDGPTQWWWHIAPATIDTQTTTRCPLAQLYRGTCMPGMGGFLEAPEHFREYAVEYGFAVSFRGWPGDATYPELDAEWRAEIRRRRAAATAAVCN